MVLHIVLHYINNLVYRAHKGRYMTRIRSSWINTWWFNLILLFHRVIILPFGLLVLGIVFLNKIDVNLSGFRQRTAVLSILLHHRYLIKVTELKLWWNLEDVSNSWQNETHNVWITSDVVNLFLLVPERYNRHKTDFPNGLMLYDV
jgi:hypothetical protein